MIEGNCNSTAWRNVDWWTNQRCIMQGTKKPFVQIKLDMKITRRHKEREFDDGVETI